MYKICKTEQSAKRQRQLEQGLLKALEQRRFEDISISELCQQMGVPRKSFYRYFSSKDGALHAMIDHTLMEYELSQRDTYLSGQRTLAWDLNRFFCFWRSHADMISALEKSGISGVLVQRAIDYALTESVFPGRFLPGESRDIQVHVVMFSICGLLSMTLKWHQRGYDTPVEELVKLACRALTQPLFPEPHTLI